jgi:ubiquinol-cytochrome c reductase cytochrome b subunit
MGLLWHQKHTQFPGPGRTENNVVGERMFPAYAAKGGGFFMIVFGMLAALGGLFQINPVWLYGPYEPGNVSAGSQPDWYIGFLEGSLRIMPNWEFRGFGYTIPFMILVPGVVIPGVMFTLFALWPWIEQRMTGDKAYHNLLQRPRESPVRAGAGMMALTFYGVLVASGANDIFASIFHLNLNVLTWAGRIAIIILPPIAYKVTKLICEALNRKDAEERAHGYETGIIRRLPTGEFIEVHAPLPPAHESHLIPVETTTFAQLSERAHGDLVAAAVGAESGNGSANGSGHSNGSAGKSRGGLVDFFVKRD